MSDTTRIEVALGDRSYAVLIGSGLLGQAGAHLADFARDGRLAVVSDEAVWSAQGARLQAGLAAAGLEPVPILVPQGEGAKSWQGLASLVDRLLALELGRADHLVAFGGGVVGDLAGFAAAIMKRGCGFVQVPTTLLAQVDSSVGGKTGINTQAGKNLAGAFHQPSLVLIDPEVLETLDERQLRAGYAEVVKYGLLGDAAFLRWCEENGASLLAGDAEARHRAIAESVGAKARIVAEDERETGERRALLNLGHTFGHAFEAEAGFSERLLHGEAVALGMLLAFRLSVERGLCPAEDAARVTTHLETVGLPTRFTADPPALVRHMRQDKKAAAGRVPLILVRGIGKAFVERNVDLADVEAFLERERSA